MNQTTGPLRDLLERGTTTGLDDAHLLARFADHRDEDAFTALVARHGPMVWATARAVTRNDHDAADVFQATFLILAQRASTVRAGSTLAAWLHRVAHRSAVAARSAARRRLDRETEAARRRTNAPDPSDRTATVRAELTRLPAPYRLAVILCDLEGLTYAEAVARLGCTEAALRNRLARGRQRLKARLGDGGVGSLLVISARLVVPRSLGRATTALAMGQAAAPAAVLILVQGLMKGMLMTQFKLAALGILAVVGVATGGALVAPGAFPGDTSIPAPAPSPRDPVPVTSAVTIAGQVLDPAGRPVGGAAVVLAPQHRINQARPTTTTTPDGRFELIVPREFLDAVGASLPLNLIATAAGFGVGWTPDQREAPGDRVIALVAEGAPLEGRILDESRQPVAGARVVTQAVLAPRSRLEGLSRLFQERQTSLMATELVSLPIALEARTEADGSFALRGVGADRVALLTISGPTLAETAVHAMTRDGSALTLEDRHPIQPRAGIMLYPNRFELIVPPTRIIAGVVRDAGSGQPLAGYRVQGSAARKDQFVVTQVDAITDTQGRYRLVGLPPFAGSEVEFRPPAGQPYLDAIFRKQVEFGGEPVTLDWTPQRAVWLRGQVTDKATGRPLVGRVESFPFPVASVGLDQAAFEKQESAERLTDDQGRYELPVPASRSVVAFRANDFERYRTAQGAERLPFYNPERREIRETIPRIQATSYHVLAEVDTAPAAELVPLDLQVDPEGTIELTVLDLDGQPLGGTEVQGIGDMTRGVARPQREAVVMLLGFPPHGSRRVSVLHRGRKLAGSMTVTPTNGPTQTLRLAPWGEVRGRIVRTDGTPRPNANIMAGPHFSKRPRVEPFDILPDASDRGGARTDAEGRFHIVGLIPGMHYGASVTESGLSIDGDLCDDLTVLPGEVKDLGDVVVVRPD